MQWNCSVTPPLRRANKMMICVCIHEPATPFHSWIRFQLIHAKFSLASLPHWFSSGFCTVCMDASQWRMKSCSSMLSSLTHCETSVDMRQCCARHIHEWVIGTEISSCGGHIISDNIPFRPSVSVWESCSRPIHADVLRLFQTNVYSRIHTPARRWNEINLWLSGSRARWLARLQCVCVCVCRRCSSAKASRNFHYYYDYYCSQLAMDMRAADERTLIRAHTHNIAITFTASSSPPLHCSQRVSQCRWAKYTTADICYEFIFMRVENGKCARQRLKLHRAFHRRTHTHLLTHTCSRAWHMLSSVISWCARECVSLVWRRLPRGQTAQTSGKVFRWNMLIEMNK